MTGPTNRNKVLQRLHSRRPPLPHLLAPTFIKPGPLHELRERSVRRVCREAIVAPHTRCLWRRQETRCWHQDINGLRTAAARDIRTLLPLLCVECLRAGTEGTRAPTSRMNAFGLGRRGLVRICVVPCAHGRRVERCRVCWETAREAKIQFGGAVPHAFYPGGKAVNGRVGVCFLHALDDPVGGVGARMRGVAAPAHEVGPRGVLGVVDWVADLTCYMAEVAGVALFGL